ncbi:MAG: type I-E CRISPR-associated endoribonuclease Cas2e [Bacillota bacterium]
MLEVGPGVYTSPSMSVAVRERVWNVLTEWFQLSDSSIVMVWTDNQLPGGQAVRTLGVPPIDLVELDGIVLARRDGQDRANRDSVEDTSDQV